MKKNQGKKMKDSGEALMTSTSWGRPGVPVHGGISIVFISIHGVVTQFVNVSFLFVPVHNQQVY